MAVPPVVGNFEDEYMRINFWIVFLLGLCMGNVWADTTVSAPIPVPVLQQRVTDLTNTLNSTQIADLAQKLAAFEQQKGTQLAVLLVPTTQPESIEQYSMRVVEQWKLGRKGVDDGVLLLIALNDRRLRIEVGRGLEGSLTDVICSRIIRENMTPEFKRGDFNAGITSGVTRIIQVVNGEKMPSISKVKISDSKTIFAVPTISDVIKWLVFGGFGVIFTLVFLLPLGIDLITFIYGRKLSEAPFLRKHSVLRDIVLYGENVKIGTVDSGSSGSRSSSDGGSSSGDGGGGYSGGYSGGGGDFGGGGSSGSW